MATEERLIYASEVLWRLRMLKEGKIDDPFFGGKRNTIWELALNSAISRVEDCPTVDAVEVVHGRWIHVPSSDMMTGKAYKCSECNKMRYGSYMPNYCQCCGAKMDGDGNG